MERATELLLSFVVNAAWQASVIAVAGLAVSRLVRGRPRVHALALTLVACVAAPALTLLPRQALPRATAIAIAAPQVAPRGAGVMGGLYLAGLLYVSARLALAAIRARRIAASSTEIHDRLRLSSAIGSPITIGRTVFLPPAVAGDSSLLAAALAHERAHVRHHDYFVHVALECLALPLYFHPLVALVRRALAEARELACDDEAASAFGAKEYAAALVRIASLAAPPRAAMAMSMTRTAIERRLAALLHRPAQPRRRAAILLIALPVVVAAACTRVNVSPAIAHATLCGRWSLVKMSPGRYDAFVQTIEQGPTRIAVRQHRVKDGRTLDLQWSVVADGVTRPVGGIRATVGSATWKDGSLHVRMTGPGAHRESAQAFIRDGRLICDGESERGRYHAEFERIDP